MNALILLLGLTPLNAAPRTAQVQPCVWPNRCAAQTVEVVQVQPCVWPRVCRQSPVA